MRGSGRPDWRLLLRDRSHDTGKLLQDGSRYSARLRSSGAHPPPAPLRPPRPPRHPHPHFLSGPRRVPSEKRLPAVQGARGQAEGAGAGREGPGPGSPAGGQGSGSLGLGLPRRWGAPGPPPAFAWSFVLFLPTTCLSSGSERAQRKGRHSRRVSPLASEGRFWVREEIISSSPSLPPLFSFVASTLGYDTVFAVFPPPTWEFAVWTRSEHSKLSPSKLRSGVEQPPRSWVQRGTRGCLSHVLALQRSRAL